MPSYGSPLLLVRQGEMGCYNSPSAKATPVRIPSSDNTELIAANKLTILGRVTNPVLQNTRSVINFLPQVWGLEGRVEGREMGPEKFQFRFRSDHDLQVVLSKGPYHYKRWMLLLQRWEPTVSDLFPHTISFWIHIHGVPLHFCNEPTITTIGENLGHLEDKFVDEAKIRVEFNGLQPLEMTMEIQLPSDDIVTVEFEYMKIEKQCFTCFSLFHEDDTCPIRPRNAPPIKERKLGITQRIALQCIEADKRRGYRRPSNQPASHNTRREDNRRAESRQRTSHYSDHRDTQRTPRDSNSLSLSLTGLLYLNTSLLALLLEKRVEDPSEATLGCSQVGLEYRTWMFQLILVPIPITPPAHCPPILPPHEISEKDWNSLSGGG